MLVLIEEGRAKAYSMYGVVSAMFSAEGRRHRGASATPSTATVATSFGAMFTDNEGTGEKLRVCDPEALNAFLRRQNPQEVQNKLTS